MERNTHRRIKNVDSFKKDARTCANYKLGSNKPLASRLTRRAIKEHDRNLVELELDQFEFGGHAPTPEPRIISAHWEEGNLRLIRRR